MNDDEELNFTVALFLTGILSIYCGFLYVTGWFDEQREREKAQGAGYCDLYDSFYTY
jgi:hypothetical protein